VEQQVLVFRSANVHRTDRALRRIRERIPAARITLVVPARHLEYLSGSPLVDTLCVYDAASDGVWKSATRLLKTLRRHRFDLVIILSPALPQIAHLYSVILFSLLISAERRILLDPHDREVRVSPLHLVSAAIDGAIFVIGTVLARIGTALVLTLCDRVGRTRPGWASQGRSNGTRPKCRVGVLIPVLPDLSHTFVYREILAMKRHGADFVPIVLEEGDATTLHPEAKQLMDVAIAVPRWSLARYVLSYLYVLVTSPVRLARLIHIYLPYCRGDRFLFLRFDHYQSVYHPMRAFALAALLRRLGITHVHAYGSTYPATRAMAAAMLLNITYSFSTFVDFDYPTEFRMLAEKIRWAAFAVATTEYCLSRILALTSTEFRSKIHTIYLSIDPAYGGQGNSRRACSTPIVVGVGRLVEKKGFGHLLRAVALLHERGVRLGCVIIGDGPERRKLEALARAVGIGGIVQFTGAMSNDRVRDHLKRATILVAPSVYASDGERDGIPTVLLEAMSCGVPVISTPVSGIPELISNEENGLLVPAHDAAALARAIERLLHDALLRQRLAERARKTVESRFDIRQSSRVLWSLIESASRTREAVSR